MSQRPGHAARLLPALRPLCAVQSSLALPLLPSACRCCSGTEQGSLQRGLEDSG